MKSRLIATIVTLSLLGACAATQKPAGRMEDVAEVRATVTAIDPQQRMLTLRNSAGEVTTVEAGPEVRNFDQIAIGDEVVTSYTEAIAWQVKPASQGTPGIRSQDEVNRAQPGDKPAGSIGRSTTVTATITQVDLPNGTVTITGPGGRSQTIKARDISNLRKVQVGDLVDITYTEALAVAVRPVGK